MAGEYRVKIMLQGAVADVRAQLALVEKQLKPLQIKLDTGEATKKEIKQYRELATEYKQLSKMVQETDKAMATADANKRKRLEAEAKAQGNTINKNLEASQKQTQVDEANHRKRLQMLQTERQQSQQSRTTQVTQYAPIGGDRNVNLASMERYNQYISQQNSAFKAGRISAEQYTQSIDRIISQTQRWSLANDSLRARVVSNMAQINRATSTAGASKPIDEAKVLNNITRLQQGVTKMTTGSGAAYLDPARINAINSSISALSSSFRTMTRPEIANEISRIRTSMAGVNGEAQNLSRNSLNLGNTFFKFALWMGISTVFMQTFNAIRDGVKYIVDMDNALNEIRIVTMQSSEEVAKLALSYNALGQAMGVSTKEITKTAVDLYRQGLVLDEVNERMIGIIKYSKIAGIELAESNKIITATMNNLGVSAEKTIDVMAYMGDASAANAEEIGIALQRSAATAAEAGISFEKVSSWVATVSEKTRESAATIGKVLADVKFYHIGESLN